METPFVEIQDWVRSTLQDTPYTMAALYAEVHVDDSGMGLVHIEGSNPVGH